MIPDRLVQMRLPKKIARYVRLKISPGDALEPGAIRASDGVQVEHDDPSPLPFLHHIDVPSPRQRLRSIGVCIYCGAQTARPGTTDRLTDEHIIPEGLGGNLTADEASCYACARSTNTFEGSILNTLLFSPRRALGIKGKRRPKCNDHPLITFKDGQERRVELPIEAHPTILIFPLLLPPRLISLREKNDGAFAGTWITQLNPSHSLTDEGLAFASPSIDTLKFSQLLAKIGHAFACAHFGIDRFDDGVPIINGGLATGAKFVRTEFSRTEFDGRCFDFVGSTGLQGFAPSSSTHSIGVRTVVNELFDYDEVIIRLFGSLGTPVYRVIVSVRRAPPL